MRNRFLSPALKRILLLLLAVNQTSCSNEEPAPDEDPPEVYLSAFVSSGTEEFQIDAVSGREDPQVISLTDELGLKNLFFALREIDENSVAFYSWQGQQSRVYYKELSSGSIFTAEDICAFSEEGTPNRTVRRVSGNSPFVVMPYSDLQDTSTPRFSVRILEKTSGECRDVTVPEINASGIENYLIEGSLMAVYFLQEGTGAPLISLVNLKEGTLITTLILDEDFMAATLRGSELWIFNQDSSYLVYNAQSDTITRSGTAPGLPLLGPGMFDSRFSGDQLLVRYFYQQPSLFFAQPAVYDFAQGTMAEGSEPFLPELQARIEQQTGDRVLFGGYGVDLPSGTIAMIYVRGSGLAEGGVAITNFGLDRVEVLPLPFIPEHVEIREVR